MSPAALQARLKSLIASGHTETAVAELVSALAGTAQQNDAAHFSARYQQLRRDEQLGLLSQSERNQQHARLSYDLLRFIDHIGDPTAPVPPAAPPSGGPAVPGYLAPAGIGSALLLAIVLLVVFLPCPSSAQFIVFRIALALGAAGLAAVIPGFFEVAYKPHLRAGGALAVFAFVYLINPAAAASGDDCNQPFDFTIFLEDAGGSNILHSTGSLSLRLGNDRREEAIDAKGSATFRQLPAQAAGDTAAVELLATGWQFASGQRSTRLPLSGTEAVLTIQRDSALYCCISGVVRDPGNRPLPGATLDILGVLDTSDVQGRFELVIPVARQAESYTLTATHPRYKLWELTVYPATRTEVKILMQK